MSKSLSLRLQSSLEALSECLTELNESRNIIDALEAEGYDTPVSTSQLDRVYAQCLNARRSLETISGKIRRSESRNL